MLCSTLWVKLIIDLLYYSWNEAKLKFCWIIESPPTAAVVGNARIIIIRWLEIFKLTKCAYIYSFKRPTLPRCNTKRRTRCSIRIVIRVLDRFNSYEISALQKDSMKGFPANKRGLACFITCLKLKLDLKNQW